MADNTLEMEARLKNYISGELGKISSDVQKMSDTTKKSMKAAGDAAGAFQGIIKKFAVAQIAVQGINAAFNGLRRTLSESIGAYKTQVQANQALASALGYTNDALIQYSADLQKTTTYGDEQITQAQALIAAFVKDEDQIKMLTKATLDLAAAKGMDLRAAADLLTKSVASETNALTRYGIQVNGAAGSAQRLESAVKNVDAAFGGMAEALAQTDAGKLQQMENKLGDISEEVGATLIPYLTVWKQMQLDILKAVSQTLKFMDLATEDQGAKAFDKYKSDLEEMKKKYQDIRDTQLENKRIMEETGGMSVRGGMFDAAALAEAESKLRQINFQLKRIQGDATTTTTTPTGDPDEERRKREAARKKEEQEWNEVVETAQQNADDLRRIEEAKTEALEAQIDERIAAQEEALRIEQEIAETRAELAQLEMDMAVAEAQAVTDSFSSMADSILSIMSAFVEDERAIAYTRAILGSAQALSSLIALAVEESSSWYEALAKGIASAAEIVSLWAPIFADINSAATGGKFVTNGPQMLPGGLVVGDNPGGREEVTVRPLSSANTSTAQGSSGSYVFNFNGVNEDQFMRLMRRLERTGKIERVTMMGTV